MHQEHQRTELNYQTLLAKSLAAAQQSLSVQQQDDVRLRRIDDVSLAVARTWEMNPHRSADATWSWADGFRRYAYRHPKRFELAIWYRNAMLCGLSVGKPTYTGGALRLDVIEGSPERHPLKGQVVTLTVFAARAYAREIGADQIRIMRPVNDDVIRHYQNHGFTLQNGHASNVPTHLWQNLEG